MHRYPETKFAKKGNAISQIKHIISEGVELSVALKEYSRVGDCDSNITEFENMLSEICDLEHSIETLRRMRPVDMDTAEKAVIKKNTDRGYYLEPVEPELKTDSLCKCGHHEHDHATPSKHSSCIHCTCEEFVGSIDLTPQLNECVVDPIAGFKGELREVLQDLQNFLIEKNTAYGNSAIKPVRIFSKADPLEQINVRIDDKLSRLMKGTELPGDDDEKDLLGYLILKMVAKRMISNG